MSWTLPRLVGTARALDLLLRPRRIDAPAARELGLAHEVVAAGELATRAAEVAAELAEGPTVAFGATKQALAYAAGNTLADALDMEAALQTVTGTSQDHVDAVQAFLAKQPPRFSGR
jgi:2-(1,2-epoxy-1,2-dihydrophenyl)acetyl-CoA isomerase